MFYTFPIRPNTKTPCLAGWNHKATDDLDQIDAWGKEFPNCNWGVACGKSGLIVVDVDPDAGGESSLFQLELQYDLPPTYTVTTPSGGKHLYYKGVSRNRVRMLPGIDIRSAGGYVLKAGSSIKGNVYVVINNKTIEPAPEWLVDMIGRPKENDYQSTPIDTMDNLIDARRAAAYLASIRPAIEGEGGDHHTFSVAAAVRDLGISEGLCLELMTEHFNPRCSPPWPEDQLKHKIHNAYKYAQNPVGVESIVNPDIGFKDETPEGLFKPVSTFGHQYPPREWIAENWIPKGSNTTTLFTGEGGTGKSLAALQLGVAVATGTKWFNNLTTQMPVLYLTCEDDEAELNRRLHAIRRENPFIGIDDAPFFIMPRAGEESLLCVEQNGVANKGKFYSGMDEALGQFKAPEEHGLWILDTAADVYAGNENIRSSVNGFLKNILGGLAKKHNVTCLLIAHPAKQSGSTYAGNTAWHNGVRNRVFMQWVNTTKKGRGKKIRSITHEKANHTSGASEILLEWVDGLLRIVQAGDIEALIDRALLDTIRSAYQNQNPYSAIPQAHRYILKAEIADADGNSISAEMLKQSLQRLIDCGQVIQISGQKRGNGLYPTGEGGETGGEDLPF